jgi:hypothetical protein
LNRRPIGDQVQLNNAPTSKVGATLRGDNSPRMTLCASPAPSPLSTPTSDWATNQDIQGYKYNSAMIRDKIEAMEKEVAGVGC